PFAELPQPSVTGITAAIDLYPHEGRFHASGHSDLVNNGNVPVRTLLISARRDLRKAGLSIPASRSIRDARFGVVRFDLDRPLLPVAHTRLDFDLELANRGFNDEPDDEVVDNGTFLLSSRLFPGLGYRSGYELSDPRERKEHGLPPARE